jgi:hypothetical protein
MAFLRLLLSVLLVGVTCLKVVRVCRVLRAQWRGTTEAFREARARREQARDGKYWVSRG